MARICLVIVAVLGRQSILGNAYSAASRLASFRCPGSSRGSTRISPLDPGAVSKGRQIRGTPKYKLALSGAYTLPLAEEAGKVTLSADYSHQWGTFADNRDDTGGAYVKVIPGYGELNARIAWDRVLDSNFDLAAFATNLTDKTYVLGGYPVTALGFQTVVYGEPRVYGMSVKYHC